ncbi:MAG TPA: DUF1801 domain-containing protein [Cytophagaceae bacterium]|jgi:uncharacterized protein YdeI (YjbR/CyaY-like superfamily)|nr:DUF1801 domain-containing protein [Cytophagaceae bacterium]
MNPKIDLYLSKLEKWQQELEQLRKIILDCALTEELKWSVPVYTFQGKNIVGINGLKEFCALSFFKGALLNDINALFVQPGKNTQSGRWIKFSSVQDIIKMTPILKAYIYEAIEVEKAGLKVTLKTTADFEIPKEFQYKLSEIPSLKKAFNALTPGRQRAYLLYFSAPKLSKTRVSRIEKSIPRIFHGKGLSD